MLVFRDSKALGEGEMRDSGRWQLRRAETKPNPSGLTGLEPENGPGV